MSAYSAVQIAEYLDIIGLPHSFASLDKHDIVGLTQLFHHQIVAIPYENLSLHYNPMHSNSLDPQALYEKFVTSRRGRGYFCLEISIFFWHILRALGFQAYMAGVRIRLRNGSLPEGPYVGFRHIVCIVTLDDGSQWCCDSGFGGDGMTRPLKLEDGYTIHNLGTQEIRLTLDFMPEQISRRPEQRLWIYQYRNAPEHPWNSYYAFGEWEFQPVDFSRMNFEICGNPESFQRNQLFINRFLKHPEESYVYGKVMLVDNIVKINTGGKTHVARVCKTEQERVQALREHFGISLTETEIEGIRGCIQRYRYTLTGTASAHDLNPLCLGWSQTFDASGAPYQNIIEIVKTVSMVVVCNVVKLEAMNSAFTRKSSRTNELYRIPFASSATIDLTRVVHSQLYQN